jgi:hypothetical protein
LSLDVEEFDIPEEYGQKLSPEEKLAVSVQGLLRVLDLLDELSVVATCFTTAVFAQGHPELIRRIVTRHELASHGFAHSTFAEEDLLRSRLALEAIGQVPVTGFRRPRFAPTRLEAIAEAGYQYNSSENPIWLPGRYQNFFRPRLPYRAADHWQIPVTASPLIRFPLFWLSFKNAPGAIFNAMSIWTLKTDGFINLIFHPWEFADLAGYRLPAYVRRPDGEVLLRRLRNYLQFLAHSAEFATFTSFIHGHLD